MPVPRTLGTASASGPGRMVKGSLVPKDYQQSPGNKEESGRASCQAQPQSPPYTGSNTDCSCSQAGLQTDGSSRKPGLWSPHRPSVMWSSGPGLPPFPPPPSRETPAWHSRIPLAGVDTLVSDHATMRLRTTPRPLAPVATGWEAGGQVRGQARGCRDWRLPGTRAFLPHYPGGCRRVGGAAGNLPTILPPPTPAPEPLLFPAALEMGLWAPLLQS